MLFKVFIDFSALFSVFGEFYDTDFFLSNELVKKMLKLAVPLAVSNV